MSLNLLLATALFCVRVCLPGFLISGAPLLPTQAWPTWESLAHFIGRTATRLAQCDWTVVWFARVNLSFLCISPVEDLLGSCQPMAAFPFDLSLCVCASQGSVAQWRVVPGCPLVKVATAQRCMTYFCKYSDRQKSGCSY